jgi:hypothetical protein
VFDSVDGIKMAAYRHSSGRLAAGAAAWAAIGIDVDMESMLARRQIGEPRCNPKPVFVSDRLSVPIFLPTHDNRLAGCMSRVGGHRKDSGQSANIGFHTICPN